MHFDIVVAGGGPAGATIARLLSGLGYHVVVFEKRRFPRHQIGESLTPRILPILDFLGVRTRIESAGFLRMAGHTVCWGSDQPRTSYYSEDHSRRGFQVWRADFDSLLLQHAREGDVQVFEEHLVKNVLLHDSGVTVITPHGQTHAAFFIDATGHAGTLARQQLRQRDPIFQTLAVTGYWRGASGPPGIEFANTLIETYENGLVWSVPLHNGLRNVTLLIDWEVGARIRQSGLQEFYLAELRQVSHISRFLHNASVAIPPRAFDATWHTATHFASEHFLLVGDAGMFIDPLSSEGVHKAMASAITGVAIANTILQRPAMTAQARQFYDESQHLTYEAHYQQSVVYYREETRWPHAPFWRRRSQQQVQGSRFKVQGPSSTFHVPRSNPQSAKVTVSHVKVAPDVTLEQRPVIEGPFVELRDVVVTPLHPRGIRFLDNICLPPLLKIVAQHKALSRIIPSYLNSPEGKNCAPEAVRQILARLYQEGVLTTIAPNETRSG
jgi:flavin-dependent dehydrogenase